MARVAAAVIEADGIIVGTGSRSWVLPVTHVVDYVNPAYVRDGATVEKEATGRRKRRTNQQGHKQDTGLLHVDSMPPPAGVKRKSVGSNQKTATTFFGPRAGCLLQKGRHRRAAFLAFRTAMGERRQADFHQYEW
jgi:hypothetical protein